MKISGKTPTFICLCALVWARSSAQTPGTSAINSTGGDRLKMVVILSRHGVRSPTWTQARLNAYSAQPWPEWSVPPGYLTSRGFDLVKRFGRYNRAVLGTEGLLTANGCSDAANTFIWADTDQRTEESGRALAQGMFPGCAPAVHSLAAGETDPFFHAPLTGVKPAQADAAFSEFEARVHRLQNAKQAELIREMQQVLLGCDPQTACAPATNPAMQLAKGANVAVRGKVDHIVDVEGPLPQSSTFAEDFLLEYADGLPQNRIGWGKVDEPQLRRFLQLHSDYFELMHRTPALAKIEASNTMFHIERTLEQGVEDHAVSDAVGPVNSKVVILAGHDTNIAAVAGLLGLRWTLDDRSDDTPPGTELTFELWQNRQGAWSIRITAAMQTLSQLRNLQDLTVAAPPAQAILPLPGCGTQTQACAWKDFQRIAGAAIDKDNVFAEQFHSPAR